MYEEMQQAQDGGFGGMYYVSRYFMYSQYCICEKITSFHQLESLAEKEVKGAHIIEVDKDYEKGIIVYEARLLKGKKEYDLTYRASDGKLVAYGWEIRDWYVERGSGNLISQSRCRRLAKKRVPGGSINSLVRKRSDGVEIYKVKMKKAAKV